MRSQPGRSRRPSFTSIALAAVGFAALFSLTSICRAQEQMTLRKVEIIGLQRLSPDQVVQSTGLRLGQSINGAIIDAAADKLMKSGLFRAVSYRIRTADSDMTIIFDVQEKAGTPGAGEVVGQIQWSGNLVLSNQELSAAFAMRSGDPADRAKIDQGIEAVRKAYARKGYVAAQVLESSTRDTASRRMNLQFTLREGQQYRMGGVIIAGLSPEDTQRLKARWTLAAGAVFDDSYLDNYRSTVIRPFVTARTQRTGVRSRFDVATRPNAERQTVDVLVTFK